MPQLATLTVGDLEALHEQVRVAGAASSSMVDAASRITALLAADLHAADGGPACTTVRLLKTHRLRALPPRLQVLARRVASDADDDTQCLTLLAADGELELGDTALPEESVLPLVASVLDEVPIMPRLLTELGVDLDAALDPSVAVSIQLQQKSFNVFCARDLADDHDLLPNPAHREVIRQLGTTSLAAMGGALPTGDLLLLVIQARVPLEERVCDLLRLLAMAIKTALIPFSFAVFGAPGR